MILVDTSVWIDHLHSPDPRLAAALGNDEVGSHVSVIEELALGSLARREWVLASLGRLHRFPVISHDELMHLVASRRLWGRGLSAVDAGVLGSVLVSEQGSLWTRDRRLKAAALELGVDVFDD